MYIRGPSLSTKTPRIASGALCSFCARGFCERHGSHGLLARPLPLGGSSFGEFDHHYGGDEFFHAVQIEIDGGAVGVRFGDDAEAVLKVLDIGAFLDRFHRASWIRLSKKMSEPALGGLALTD